MSAEGVKQVIGRAVVDEAFRTLLFDKPGEALSGFDLTDEECAKLQTISRDEFDKIASEVEERVSRAGLLPNIHYHKIQ